MTKAASSGEAAPGGGLRRPPGLGEEAYGAIFKRIMTLEIPPGARITVDGLARELGVSQTPIREALARLESEGLVIKQHLIGYSAAPQLTRKQFYDTYELRMMLEPPAAGRAADNMTEEALERLQALATEMETLDKVEGPEGYARFAQLDAAFHNEIATVAGNELVVDALSRLHTHVHLFRLLYNARVTLAALDEHRMLLKALARRDHPGAQEAMSAHVIRSRDRFKAKYPT